MAGKTQAERIAALEASNEALTGAITALVAKLDAVVAPAQATDAPAIPISQSVAAVDPEAGLGFRARRAYALANKIDGRYCDGRGKHAAHGFAFAKDCDR